MRVPMMEKQLRLMTLRPSLFGGGALNGIQLKAASRIVSFHFFRVQVVKHISTDTNQKKPSSFTDQRYPPAITLSGNEYDKQYGNQPQPHLSPRSDFHPESLHPRSFRYLFSLSAVQEGLGVISPHSLSFSLSAFVLLDFPILCTRTIISDSIYCRALPLAETRPTEDLFDVHKLFFSN